VNGTSTSSPTAGIGGEGMTRRLRALSDDELLQRLSALLGHSRRVEWELVAHIGEVEERRLYAREACDSMFVYCTSVLYLSEHEAYLRIAAARAAREHPVLLAMLGDGRLHLSGIAKLAPHLTRVNRDDLLARATYKSKRQIEVLVADLAPRPDVPTSVRKLPDRAPAPPAAAAAIGVAAPDDYRELGPDRASAAPSDRPAPEEQLATAPAPADLDRSRAGSGAATFSKRALVEPLGAGRYKVQFTASAALCANLERLKALMVSSVPDGDLARIFETVVAEALERREARRFAKVKTPKKTVASADTAASTSRYIPAPVRRASHASDDGRCGFVSSGGRRCGSNHRLEFHHVVPWARGGDRSSGNIRLMCRTHNAYLAAKDYGEAVMARFRRIHPPRPSG
jgi:HNH endonuclease